MRRARLSLLISLTMILSFSVFAVVPTEFKKVDLKNFSVDYRNGLGNASFKALDISLGDFAISFKDYQVDIKKDNGKILFAKDDTSLLVNKIQGSVVDSITSLSLVNASLFVDPEIALKFRIDGGEFEMGDGIQSIGELSLECKSEKGRNGNILSFIRPCFKLGRLSIPVLNISKFSKKTLGKIFPVNDMTDEDHSAEVKRLKGPDLLREINLIVFNNNFNLTMKTKFIFNLKLKIKGTAVYQEEQNRVIFSIKKAKVGWFSIKKRFLKEIEKASIENVQVFGNNIIINL